MLRDDNGYPPMPVSRDGAWHEHEAFGMTLLVGALLAAAALFVGCWWLLR